MYDYNTMLDLAKKYSYDSFTQLQDLAFQNENTYNYSENLFIVGETSSGKTLIPLLLYASAVEEAEINATDYPRMLFVVPYRALAAQKVEEINYFFRDKDLKIIQSTGEFRQDDEAVQKGQVHVAVVITEKVFKYEARDPKFLSRYDYLILDEVGLLSDSERGVRLDFILAWAMKQHLQFSAPRIIALGTPFFDWSEYISNYRFTAVCSQKRPVPLEKVNVVHTKTGIEQVIGKSSFLRRTCIVSTAKLKQQEERYENPGSVCEHHPNEICPYRTSCRTNPELKCTYTDLPCCNSVSFVEGKISTFNEILTRICREHLAMDHQILIFINDRERVRTLCKYLFQQLRDILPEAPSADECRQLILSECGLESDDVFGIMEVDGETALETELYQAFISGIGFHSAALPNELRTYVEQKLLSSRQMRIVISTETLAFGVNSSVDTVVIAELNKHKNGQNNLLSLNEYQNYAGRAGRLRPNVDITKAKGYVYTLIRKKQLPAWERNYVLNNKPEKLYSLFHDNQHQFMPFLLLNLLPTDDMEGMTVPQIMEVVKQLPHDGTIPDEELRNKIQELLQFLKEQELASQYRNVSLRRSSHGNTDENRYCLTDAGKRLRGYVISCDDYLALLEALEEYMGKMIFSEPDRARYLYRLLQTKHAESGLNNIFYGSESLLPLDEVRSYIRMNSGTINHSFDWLDSCEDDKHLFLLAALLAWCSGESPKMLYRRFGIHYALLSKLAEEIAYLIEITQELLPLHMQRTWGQKEVQYSALKIYLEDFLAEMQKKTVQVNELFTSIYYGINTDVINELSNFLRESGLDFCPDAFLQTLSLQSINPQSARLLRRIVIRYRFFLCPYEVDMENPEMRRNYIDQLRQYKTDVQNFGPQIHAFFVQKFPDIFNT